ncbi:hypothetical protein J5X84_20110 [Streptosporangiaceae bacterium NEAU-GS5]|nr:hypothetical protein [Streptosporangiaceae bacterium NEAU-GS5]
MRRMHRTIALAAATVALSLPLLAGNSASAAVDSCPAEADGALIVARDLVKLNLAPVGPGAVQTIC